MGVTKVSPLQRAAAQAKENTVEVVAVPQGHEPLPVDYAGQWLCNKTLMEIGKLNTDGVQVSEIQWHSELKRKPDKEPIWMTSDRKLSTKLWSTAEKKKR